MDILPSWWGPGRTAVSINYIPWDLGFSIIPNFYRIIGSDDDAKVAVFSVTKVFKFGAGTGRH